MGVIMAFLGAIPGIGTIITTLTTAFFNAKVELTKAQIGGDVAVASKIVSESAIEQRTRPDALKAIASSRALTWLIIIFAAPWALYDFKVVAIDNLLDPWWYGEPGLTLPIKGQVGEWGREIHAFIFGSSTALALGNMWFGRKS